MKFFRYTVAVAAGGIVFLAAMLFLSVIGMLDGLQGGSGGKIALAAFGCVIGLALAVGAGYVLFKLEKVGATIVAVACGFFVGTALYNTLFFWTNEFYLLMGMNIGFSILFGYLSWVLFEKVLIVGTALLGSYAFVRGISMFAGHFPNEIDLMQKLANGIKPEMDSFFYGYLVGILVLFICGAVYQSKKFKDQQWKDGFAKVQWDNDF